MMMQEITKPDTIVSGFVVYAPGDYRSQGKANVGGLV